MMTTPSSTWATSAIVTKRVRPQITGTGTQMEKPGKVFYLFYFISFALKNTKKHYRYANTSNKNVTIH